MAKKAPKRNRRIIVLRKGGDPILSTVCNDVEEMDINQKFLANIMGDMLHILTNSHTAVGLAANQAGYDMRVIAIKDSTEPNGWLFMVNPKIVDHGEDKTKRYETCLSYGKKSAEIVRWEKIEVNYHTINSDGETEFYGEEEFIGLQARAVQHEIDHANGMCKVASGDF